MILGSRGKRRSQTELSAKLHKKNKNNIFDFCLASKIHWKWQRATFLIESLLTAYFPVFIL